MIWAKIVGDLGQNRNNLGHRFGPKNTKFRAKNVYLPFKVPTLLIVAFLVLSGVNDNEISSL